MSIESDTMQYFNATTDQGADPAHVELLPQVEHCPKKKYSCYFPVISTAATSLDCLGLTTVARKEDTASGLSKLCDSPLK